nr:hypothetical protein [Butyrivibrio sp. AC2005]
MTGPKSRLLNLDIDLQKKGRGYSTIHSVRGVLRPAFQMAFVDDLIRKNPFDFQLASVVVNNSVTIMGHSDIGVTLNTYTHFSIEDAKEEMGIICANA